MKQSIMIGVGALVAAGALFLVLPDRAADSADAQSVARDEGPRATTPVRARGGENEAAFDRDAPVEARVRALEDEVTRLRSELASFRLQSRVIRAGGAAGGGLDDLDSGGVIDERVREVIEDDREERMEIEADRRRERMQTRNAERVSALVAQAGLNAQQSTKIGELWDTEAETMLSLMMGARSGDRDWREVRNEVDALRQVTDDEAKELLSDEQWESYEDNRPRGPGRDRGGGGERRGNANGGR